jgi:thiol-disulfide isomerase/thioredoxin
LTFEKNLDDILSDIEMENERDGEKRQERMQGYMEEEYRNMAKKEKGERQYWGERQPQFNERHVDVPVGEENADTSVGTKKKRKPSKYNIFIGECMRGGKDMKTCAAEYKSSGRHRESNEKEEKEEDEKEFIGIFTSDGCPSCEEVKIELGEKLNGEEIVELNVTKDKDANKLYQLVGANKKGTPSFIAFTKNSVCLLNDNLEEESCILTEK